MPDNAAKRHLDGKRININEPWELRYWCQTLKCDADQLKVAIYKVGTSVAAVRKYLGSINP